MRLISVDELKEWVKNWFDVNRNYHPYSKQNNIPIPELYDILERMPTIEERKTGKWIERNPQNSDKCRLIECDQCGFAHIVGFNVPYEHWIENRNFCERCGADMRKKGEK